MCYYIKIRLYFEQKQLNVFQCFDVCFIHIRFHPFSSISFLLMIFTCFTLL